MLGSLAHHQPLLRGHVEEEVGPDDLHGHLRPIVLASSPQDLQSLVEQVSEVSWRTRQERFNFLFIERQRFFPVICHIVLCHLPFMSSVKEIQSEEKG